MIVWRISANTKTYTANDLSGEGAKITGGRWNSPGMAALYTSENRSLAALETLVHLPATGLPFNRYLVKIEIPKACWDQRLTLTHKTAPVGWDAEPASMTSIQFGDQWITDGKHPLLVVPSTIVPEEQNILVNPLHPLSATITATTLRKWLYDPRLVKP